MESSAAAYKKPNFFVAGAAKAGTTSIYHYLNIHPDVFMCPIKEPQHFSTDIRYENYSGLRRRAHRKLTITKYLKQSKLHHVHIDWVAKWEDYLDLFREATTEKAIGEVSNGYLYSQVAAQNIAQKCPDAKIVIILRDPADRAFSHYKMSLRRGLETEHNFLRGVEKDYNKARKGWGVSGLYIELGLYYEQVKRFMDTFSPDRVLVLLYDEWRSDNQSALNRVFSFLGVESPNLPPQAYNVGELTPRLPLLQVALGVTGLRTLQSHILPDPVRRAAKKLWYSKAEKKPGIDDRRYLVPYFLEDTNKLEKLLGIDLSKWKAIT